MPNITLPDGKKLSFKSNVTGYEVAEKISKSLSKQALIVSVDGVLKDLSFSIQKDSSVKIITGTVPLRCCFFCITESTLIEYSPKTFIT